MKTTSNSNIKTVGVFRYTQVNQPLLFIQNLSPEYFIVNSL